MSKSKPQWSLGKWHARPMMSGEPRKSWEVITRIFDEGEDLGEATVAVYLTRGSAQLLVAAPNLYEALRPFGETRLRPETADHIAATIIEFTGNGEPAKYVHELLTDGTVRARQALAKARGEEAPE